MNIKLLTDCRLQAKEAALVAGSLMHEQTAAELKFVAVPKNEKHENVANSVTTFKAMSGIHLPKLPEESKKDCYPQHCMMA